MKTVFMGTPAFAVPSLHSLLDSKHDVVAVVTNPDRPRGRGRKTQPTAIKEAADQLGLRCLQPQSLAAQDFCSSLVACQCDLFVVVAFSILPRPLLAIPRQGSVNLHPSLLPAYRGAAPIAWALFNGERQTGVTTFLLNPRIDAGDILLQEHVAIDREETAGELEHRTAQIGADLVVATVDGIESERIQPRSQGESGVSRAPKLSKEDGRLVWSKTTEWIHNRIRGANPIPGAFTTWGDGHSLKVHRARRHPGDKRGAAGTVIAANSDTSLVVATADGAIVLDEVQPAGRKRMPSAAFVRGYDLKPGDRLGT